MKPTRLKVAELKKIKESFRQYLPKNLYTAFAAICSHIVWLEEENLALTREIRERVELDLFVPPPAPEKSRFYVPPQPKTEITRGERLYDTFQAPGAIEAYVKYFGIGTTVEALKEEANIWARENGKEELK